MCYIITLTVSIFIYCYNSGQLKEIFFSCLVEEWGPYSNITLLLYWDRKWSFYQVPSCCVRFMASLGHIGFNSFFFLLPLNVSKELFMYPVFLSSRLTHYKILINLSLFSAFPFPFASHTRKLLADTSFLVLLILHICFVSLLCNCN